MAILEKYRGQKLVRRIITMLIAVTVMGFGTALCFIAAMGADPCSSMNLGLSMKAGISFGTFQACSNIVILIAVFFTQRKFIGLGTIGNMFICGFAADLFKSLLGPALPPTDDMSIAIRILLTIAGAAFNIVGCSLYMTANLGMAPYDCVAFIIINLYKRRKLKYRWVRMTQDAIALIIGFICGASVGIGTVIMVFATGPLIPVCNKYISAKILGIHDISRENSGAETKVIEKN